MKRSIQACLLTGLVVAWVTSLSAQSGSMSSAPAGSEGDVQVLRERAAEYWAARVAGDAQAQWQLLEPRGKGRLTPQEYGAQPGGGRYVAYQVEGATVNGLFATVKVRVLVQLILPPSSTPRTLPRQVTIVDDSWIRIGGVWYRRLDQEAPEAAQARQP